VSEGPFISGSAYEVDRTKYAVCWGHPHVQQWPGPILQLPTLSELSRILYFDVKEHERIWRCAACGCQPKVLLNVMAAYGDVGGVKDLVFDVDTGAVTSTLNEKSTKELKIDRTLRPGESLWTGIGVGGQSIVGVHRWIKVRLGGAWQEIPVLVPPEPVVLCQRTPDNNRLGLVPQRNLLGRAQIMDNYFLCLDSCTVYAFRDILSRRQCYSSDSLTRFKKLRRETLR
jgi:hypothetical protein